MVNLIVIVILGKQKTDPTGTRTLSVWDTSMFQVRENIGYILEIDNLI